MPCSCPFCDNIPKANKLRDHGLQCLPSDESTCAHKMTSTLPGAPLAQRASELRRYKGVSLIGRFQEVRDALKADWKPLKNKFYCVSGRHYLFITRFSSCLSTITKTAICTVRHCSHCEGIGFLFYTNTTGTRLPFVILLFEGEIKIQSATIASWNIAVIHNWGTTHSGKMTVVAQTERRVTLLGNGLEVVNAIDTFCRYLSNVQARSIWIWVSIIDWKLLTQVRMNFWNEGHRCKMFTRM